MVDQQPMFEAGGPPYEVVGLQVDDDAPAGHDHVRSVKTLDPDGGETRWKVVDVIAAIRAGERFRLSSGGSESRLVPTVCPACPVVTLGIAPAAATPDVRRAG